MVQVGGVYPYPPEKFEENPEKNWKTWMFTFRWRETFTAAGRPHTQAGYENL